VHMRWPCGTSGRFAGVHSLIPSDADLTRTYAQYLPDEPGEDTGTPIAEYIAGDTYEHFDEHRGWIAALT
ncbi:MAG TPA: hypothetical protein VFL91_16545, partial [Thermomicrobiales bacterium]|nr:hypothetical protein [Thermomicrobiales bacterium]